MMDEKVPIEEFRKWLWGLPWEGLLEAEAAAKADVESLQARIRAGELAGEDPEVLARMHRAMSWLKAKVAAVHKEKLRRIREGLAPLWS